MATKSIAWNDGSGDYITMTYTGSGNGSITITSDVNNGSARSQTVTVETTEGSPVVTKTITISQAAMPNLPYVDLGLPSGLLWAKGNLCKDGQGNYYMGLETDYGSYFSWGNIDGHNVGDGYSFDSASYANTPGSALTSSIAVDDAQHDAALARLGSNFRLPKRTEFKELYDETDQEWTSVSGIYGYKFMKKTDHSVYIFIPASGIILNTSRSYKDTQGRYISSTYRNASNAYILNFSSSSINPESGNYSKYNGYTVRPVYIP